MKQNIKDFRDLKVWQESMLLAEAIFKLTRKFPDEEKYVTVIQMRKSALSVPSNISEGEGKDSLKDYIRHLSMSNGSLSELRTQIILSSRLGYIKNDIYNKLDAKIDEVAKMLKSMKKSLTKRL